MFYPAEVKRLELQNRALRDALLARRAMEPQHSREDHECDECVMLAEIVAGEVLSEMKQTEKRKCEHEWSHIEDYHFFCAKCKTTADLCGTCSTEKTTTREGGLVCLKCHPQ